MPTETLSMYHSYRIYKIFYKPLSSLTLFYAETKTKNQEAKQFTLQRKKNLHQL